MTDRSWWVCPTCRGDLTETKLELVCEPCGREYPIRDGQVSFREEGFGEADDAESRYQQGIRGRLRRSGLYPLVFRLLAPVLVTGPDPARRWGGVARNGGRVIDLGCGNDRRDPNFLGVDLLDYPEVDVVCEGDRLPFPDASVDAIVSIAVWEHVPRLQPVIAEVERVLRPGGGLFVVVPFLQPFHAAPHDYRRWTLPGLEADLESGFQIEGRGVYCGPASTATWFLAEGLAGLLSFGSPRLREVWSLGLQALLSPIKWLDLVMARTPQAHRLASALFIEGTRLGGEGTGLSEGSLRPPEDGSQ